MRTKSLQSVQNNYSVLQELWDFVLDDNVDPDIRARVSGVRTQMESFDYTSSASALPSWFSDMVTTYQLLSKTVPSLQLKASV